MAELDLSNFNQLSQSGTYEYFDAEGNRYTVSGNDQLKPSSIKKDVNLLGQTGSLQGIDLSGVNPYDLRAGVAGIGKMDPNATCTTKDDCVGAGKLWQDVSTSNGEAQDCQAGSGVCHFHSPMLKQDWVFLLVQPVDTWANAAQHCANLSTNNGTKSDWRLPTQKETLIASVHGLSKLGFFGFYTNGSSERSFWTSTANSYNKTGYGRMYYAHVDDYLQTGVPSTQKRDIVCVHDVQNNAP